MQLSKATLELLRDEAYVTLCREALQEKLRSVEQEKEGMVSSRPPFGVLAAKKTRDAYDAMLRAADDTAVALRERLTQTARFETWLHRCIRRDLAAYLESVNAEYRRVDYIRNLVAEWEKAVTRTLPDMLVAFARELRGLRLAAAEVGRAEQTGAHELALLYEIIVRLEEHQDRLSQMSSTITRFALEIGLIDVRVPPLPQFRRRAWIDWLCAIPLEQAIADITRVEGEVRAFLNGGVKSLVGQLQASRVSCVQRQGNYVQQYWDQLREHALAHWVEERDVDQVLRMLAMRYDGEIARRQREMTHNPFQTDAG